MFAGDIGGNEHTEPPPPTETFVNNVLLQRAAKCWDVVRTFGMGMVNAQFDVNTNEHNDGHGRTPNRTASLPLIVPREMVSI